MARRVILAIGVGVAIGGCLGTAAAMLAAVHAADGEVAW